MKRHCPTELCRLAFLPGALSLALLCSCGDSKTSALSFEEFKAKLQSLCKPFERKCDACNGTGKMTIRKSNVKELIGRTMLCENCNGTGVAKGLDNPTRQEVNAALGEPEKKQQIAGDTYWYYTCSDGMIQLKVFLREDSDGTVRVVFGDPNLY